MQRSCWSATEVIDMSANVTLGLRLFSVILSVLATTGLLYPEQSLLNHGIDISSAPPSGFAEIRAFYFGTLGTSALAVFAASCGDSSAHFCGYAFLCSLLSLFSIGRVFSTAVDGPANNNFSVRQEGI
eukprot:m.483234 g.483234  ORF g.483234 m.483234 type:complete len:128 (-) comp21723_c0_seq58:191-574(-)